MCNEFRTEGEFSIKFQLSPDVIYVEGKAYARPRVTLHEDHKCGICAFADRKPHSLFGRLIRWHHTWCPCWAAHTKVHGQKPPS